MPNPADDLIDLLLEDNFTVLYEPYVKVLGSPGLALLFQHICSMEKNSVVEGTIIKGDWFEVSIKSIKDRFLYKRRKQEGLIKKLKELDVIEVKQKGFPARRYFKINSEVIYNLLVPVVRKDYYKHSFRRITNTFPGEGYEDDNIGLPDPEDKEESTVRTKRTDKNVRNVRTRPAFHDKWPVIERTRKTKTKSYNTLSDSDRNQKNKRTDSYQNLDRSSFSEEGALDIKNKDFPRLKKPKPKIKLPFLSSLMEEAITYWNNQKVFVTLEPRIINGKLAKRYIEGVKYLRAFFNGRLKHSDGHKFTIEEFESMVDNTVICATDERYFPRKKKFLEKLTMKDFLAENLFSKSGSTKPVCLLHGLEPKLIPAKYAPKHEEAKSLAEVLGRKFQRMKGLTSPEPFSEKDQSNLLEAADKLIEFRNKHKSSIPKEMNTDLRTAELVMGAVKSKWNNNITKVGINYLKSDAMFNDALPGYLTEEKIWSRTSETKFSQY